MWLDLLTHGVYLMTKDHRGVPQVVAYIPNEVLLEYRTFV